MERNKKFLLIGLVAVAVIAIVVLLPRDEQPPMSPPLPTLEERREAFLRFDPETATPEARLLRMQEAQEISVQTDVINVGRCALNPPIVRVAVTSSITFTNNSTGTAGVSLADVPYIIPAGESRIVRVSAFGKQDRLYGYGCNSPAGGAPGFILVR